MSTTMDWTAHAGAGPQQYQEVLVPAMFAPFAEDLADAVGIERGSRILDVACGTGALSRAAASCVGSTGHVTAVDLAAPMLDVARAQPADAGSAPIDYREGSAERLPVPDASFDVILCQQGLQFFSDRVAALRRMRAALAPDGIVAVATWCAPGPESMWSALADALDTYIDTDAGDRMRSPFALHDPDEVVRLFAEAGFERIEVSQRTLTVRFAPREGVARNYLLATPLAETFLDASPDQQDRILARGTAAADRCDGGEHEVRYPMTTNVVIARAVTSPGCSSPTGSTASAIAT